MAGGRPAGRRGRAALERGGGRGAEGSRGRPWRAGLALHRRRRGGVGGAGGPGGAAAASTGAAAPGGAWEWAAAWAWAGRPCPSPLPPPPPPPGPAPLRTPAACFARWLTLSAGGGGSGPGAPRPARRSWTPAQDAALAGAVAAAGLGNWVATAAAVPGGFTPHQCMHRWRAAVAPALGVGAVAGGGTGGAVGASVGGGGGAAAGAAPAPNVVGRWTAAEDAALRGAIAAAGGPGAWARIAASVPGRTDIQCRSRWTQLDAKERPGGGGAWAAAEARALEAAVGAVAAACQAEGRVRLRWPLIAARLAGGPTAADPPRTPDECRWAWHSPQARAARKALAARPAALVAGAAAALERGGGGGGGAAGGHPPRPPPGRGGSRPAKRARGG